MTVETLGDAWRAGWRVKTRCAHGKRDGLKSIRECHREAELDMETLIWTRGAAMPLSDLSGRLRCPACRSLRINVAFVPPPVNNEDRASPLTPREDLGALPHHVELVKPGGSLDRMIAASADIEIARAAFAAAVERMKLDEGFSLVLRHFGRSMATYPEQERPETAHDPTAVNAEYARLREGLPKGRTRRWK